MEDVKSVLKTIDAMKSDGASAADIGAFAKSSGYDLKALSESYKTYKETGEVDIAGAGTSMLQGLTFGFSEEIGGAFAELTGGDYDEYVSRQRNKMKLYQQQNPIASAAFEVVGSLPTMFIPGGGVAGVVAKGTSGASRVATAVRAAAAAGAEGALYGFGTGEGLEDSLANAASTGAISAVTGGLLSPLTKGTASAKMSKALTPEQKAVEKLSQRVTPETVDTFSTPAFQQQAGMTLADTGDEAARYLRGMRGLDSQVSQLVDETLDTRWKNQYQRITKIINEGFDSDPQIAKAMSGDLADMKDAAGLAYAKLYNDFLDIKSPGVGAAIRGDKLLSDNWDDAVKYAIKEASGDPVKAKALKTLPKAKNITDDTVLPMEILDTVKKYVDDDLRVAMRATDNKAASRVRALQSLKTDFVASVDDVTDNAYAKVRNNFAEPAKMEEALELGRQSFKRNVSADEIRSTLQDMNPQEAKAYMAGVLQNIYGTINNTGYSRDVLNTLLGTPEMTAKLKALMPNEQAWKRFTAAVKNEARQVRTKNLVRGGSNTADKLQDIGNADALLDDAVALMFDPSLATVNASAIARVSEMAKNFVKRIASNAENRSLQAKMLLETDPAKKAKLAKQIAEARRALAERAQKSAEMGTTKAGQIGARTGLAIDESEDSPLVIQVTKPLPQ